MQHTCQQCGMEMAPGAAACAVCARQVEAISLPAAQPENPSDGIPLPGSSASQVGESQEAVQESAGPVGIDDLFDDFDPLDDFKPLTSPGTVFPGGTGAGEGGFDAFGSDEAGAGASDAGGAGASGTAPGEISSLGQLTGLDLTPPPADVDLQLRLGGDQPDPPLLDRTSDVFDFIESSLVGESTEPADMLDFVQSQGQSAPPAKEEGASAAPQAPAQGAVVSIGDSAPPVIPVGEEAQAASGKEASGRGRLLILGAAALAVLLAGGYFTYGEELGLVSGKGKGSASSRAVAPPPKAREADKGGATLDGATSKGAVADGATADGAAADGATADGAAADGAAAEGAEPSKMQTALALEGEGKLDEALEAYLAAAEEGEGAPGLAHHRASVILLSQGDSARSLLEAKRAVDANGEDLYFRLQLSTAAVASGRSRDALSALEGAMEHHPSNPLLLTRLGSLHLSMGNPHMAIELLGGVEAVAEEKGLAMVLGEAYLVTGQWSRASKTLEPFASTEGVAYPLGWAYLEQGRSRDALPHLVRALEEENVDPLAHRHLGYVYKELGRRQDAVRSFSRYLEEVPDATDRREIEDEITTLRR